MTKGGVAMRIFVLMAALAGMLASPAAAEKLDPRDMLVASSPAKDSIVAEGIETIALTFAEPAEVISVTVRLPDDTEVNAEPETPYLRRKQKQVRYRLPVPLEEAGGYTISYLLTSKSFKSLNGFVEFEIAGDPGSTVPGPPSAPGPQERD
ncbi:methionine-rich copper-binding protein CopC [Erythromicrobium ramosum]|uniref:Methionine-rich copper-binding protein CopC n=1 Tax=Erythrobacter ramosus TaxID=35811 RepID=A0A6I4UKZ8_9SPHN|nr:copper resistance protein CopC [Erythrobacter ramosus]MBB3776467.1 methionine-rich copper-binding protein CopC [Erythrobacter ramosus]MXP38454.1 hypothetical protein [Erythrobacter ramosus]